MKNKLLIIGIISLLLFSSCKKSDEILPEGFFEISAGWAQAAYDYVKDTTFLAMYVKVGSRNEVGGTITSWKFVYKAGNMEVLEINDRNHSSYVPYIVSNEVLFNPGHRFMIPAYQEVGFRLEQGQYFNAGSPSGAYYDESFICHGYVLKGNIIPDNMDITLKIDDDHSYSHTCKFNIRVSYMIN